MMARLEQRILEHHGIVRREAALVGVAEEGGKPLKSTHPGGGGANSGSAKRSAPRPPEDRHPTATFGWASGTCLSSSPPASPATR
jgi:hypothetical protein